MDSLGSFKISMSIAKSISWCRKSARSAELNNGPPEDFGERIKAIPHAKVVMAGLMDLVSFPDHDSDGRDHQRLAARFTVVPRP